jgi:rhodanese-related sulfurtransferase
VARELIKNGWPRARALVGGLDAWKRAGFGVEPKAA